MADYWKSQAKKFCDFCKCWIADNRPSVEFHEKGKRHKENVEKRLKEMTKKSCKDHQSDLKIEDQMRKMEQAAMKAYMKDVEEKRDFTSHLIHAELTMKAEQTAAKNAEKALEKSSNTASTSQVVHEPKAEVAEEIVIWHETISDEGHTYYWNTETGEAVWEAPEKFLSLTEQKSIADKKLKEEKEKIEEEKLKAEEDRAAKFREQMKKRAAKKEKKVVVPFDPLPMGPAPRKDPYGSWKSIDTTPVVPVDFQLPKGPETVQVRVAVVPKEPTIRFKEKTVTSSTTDSKEGVQTDFKKRKFNSGSKRQTRQRLDDD